MSATENNDQYALSLLTKEEIDALNAELSDDEFLVMRQQKEAEQLIAEEGDDPDDKEVDQDNKDSEQQANAENSESQNATDAKENSEHSTEQPGNADSEVASAAANKSGYQAALPEDFQAQVDDLKNQKIELAKKFKEGEIDIDEFTDLSEALLDKREALNAIKLKAEISQDMGAQSAQQEWENTVRSFVATTAKTDGIDYGKDAEKQSDLDGFLKVLAGNPAHSDKPQTWFLHEAHKRVMALHDLTPTKVTPDPKPKPNRKPPVDGIPTNLAHVAGSDGPGDVGNDEFVDIDKLEGMALEKAISAMSPAQREKYLAG